MSRPTFRVRTAVLPSALLALWLVGERGRLLRRSTWKAIREGGVRKVFSLKGIHSYVYGRWTNQYVATLVNRVYPRLGDRGFEWWRHRYHAKVLTTEHAEAIVMLDHDLPQRDLEQIIPYRMARRLVLSGPPDVAAYECACRHARQTHCEPTQVCLAVGQPVVDFILEHNPRSSRRLTQAEADRAAARRARPRARPLGLVQGRRRRSLLRHLQLLQVLLRRHRGDGDLRQSHHGLLGLRRPGGRRGVHIVRGLRGGLPVRRPLDGRRGRRELGEVHGVRRLHEPV